MTDKSHRRTICLKKHNSGSSQEKKSEFSGIWEQYENRPSLECSQEDRVK